MNEGKEFVLEQPLPLRKQVFNYLRDNILSRSFTPDTRIVEAQIAAKLGVSRTPVREALHLLEQEGFIESIPRVGYKVVQLDEKELDEVIEIRRVNESLACTLAVRNYSEETLAAFRKNIVATRKSMKQEDSDQFLRCDEQFHEILAMASGSRHLLSICQLLRRLMLRYRSRSVGFLDSYQGILDGHIAIVEAYGNRDEQGMIKGLNAHLDYVCKEVCTRSLAKAGSESQD
ncbi:DNA-binding GntR family transcriptional regulator [Pseudodesulfovibrio indicus]|uniref:DNA-binding GntR family transcriptional regulator n=1 Tax=Pseudodesulfovibrio indicus TaxID=1716143 RepID=A0A126QJ21_9BACT|nr:hypothetical protein AWY79_02065 [Pseudodesulfovibrio indicus]TDT87052.1 DNA-binding GntR family transcriptional regulator [Pseudodesulfovibrio indicus]